MAYIDFDKMESKDLAFMLRDALSKHQDFVEIFKEVLTLNSQGKVEEANALCTKIINENCVE